MNASSITNDNRYIGAGGFDQFLNTRGVVYQLVNGAYVVLRDDYRASRGEDVSQMNLCESPNGVVSFSPYVNGETGAEETALLGLDGVVHAELSGTFKSAVTLNKNMYVTTQQGADGYVTVIDKDYNKTTVTAIELFGAGYEFQLGSLAATEDGKLVVLATRIDDGKVFAKVYEVPQDVTIAQVDPSSIVIPQLMVGQSGLITWGAVTGATGYEYQISQGTTIVHAGSSTEAKFSSPGSLPVGEYTLAVRATNDTLASEWTEVDLIVRLSAVEPRTISGLPAVAGEESFVTWETVSGATGYVVWVSEKGNDKVNQYGGSVGSDTRTFNLQGLNPGEYNIWLKALGVKSVLNAAWSRKKTFTVVVDAVTGLAVTQMNPATSSVISWSAQEFATSYRVLVSRISGARSVILNQVLNATSLAVSGGFAAGTYRLWVQGIDSTGKSGIWSKPMDFTLFREPVSLVIRKGADLLRPTLLWNAPKGATSTVWVGEDSANLVPIQS